MVNNYIRFLRSLFYSSFNCSFFSNTLIVYFRNLITVNIYSCLSSVLSELPKTYSSKLNKLYYNYMNFPPYSTLLHLDALSSAIPYHSISIIDPFHWERSLLSYTNSTHLRLLQMQVLDLGLLIGLSLAGISNTFNLMFFSH